MVSELLVELEVVGGRRQRRGLAHHRLGLPHLPLVLVGRRQQVEVVHVVPVELGCDALRGVVGLLQLVGAPKGRDGLVDPADPAQVVAPHVVRVRDGRREPRERLAVLEGQRDLPIVSYEWVR